MKQSRIIELIINVTNVKEWSWKIFLSVFYSVSIITWFEISVRKLRSVNFVFNAVPNMDKF